MSRSNEAAQAVEETEEGSTQTKGNVHEPHTVRTQSRGVVSQGLEGVREAARKSKQTKFTALLHHLTVERLRGSFNSLQRAAAPGVDGVTWKEYENGLAERLADLHSRIHRGAYRAQPSKRTYIPKADGKQRPLGIAALEDKIVQQAVVTILNAIYEEDFMGFSYGFRPRRGCHMALDALTVGICRRRVNWVLDCDIREAERFLEQTAGAAGQVRAGITSGENTVDGVWLQGREGLARRKGRQAGQIRLSGVHAPVWT